MATWTPEESLYLKTIYPEEKDLDKVALFVGKTRLQVLRKLTSLGIYEKKEKPIPAMNKDMLGREIGKLLGIKLLTFGNMSRTDLRALLAHLEENLNG